MYSKIVNEQSRIPDSNRLSVQFKIPKDQVSEKLSERRLTSTSTVPPVLPSVMRLPSAVASAPAGGGGEQEEGEPKGGSEVLVSGRARVIRRVASGEWEDEESLAYSPFAIRHSLFTVDIRPLSAGRDTPQTAWREDAPAT